MSAWARAGHDSGQPSRLQRLEPAIPFLVIALALLAGIVAGRTSAPQQTVITRHVPLAPGSTQVESGVPTGYQHTSVGAVDAATNYAVAFNGPLLLDRETLRRAITAVASRDYRNDLEAQTASALQALNSAYGVQSNARNGATPAIRLVPIAYRLESYSPVDARVSIWAVWMIAEEGILAPQQAWITTQLSLRWLGDWKLYASGSHPGPVPQPPQEAVPEQSQPLAPPLTSDYQEYQHVGS